MKKQLLFVCNIIAFILQTASGMQEQPHAQPREDLEQLLIRYESALEMIAEEYRNALIFEGNRLCNHGLHPAIVWDIDDTLVLSANAESFLMNIPLASLDLFSRPAIQPIFRLFQSLKATGSFTFFFLTSLVDSIIGYDETGQEVTSKKIILANLIRCGYCSNSDTPLDNILCMPFEWIQSPESLNVERPRVAVNWKHSQLRTLKEREFHILAYFDDHQEYFEHLHDILPLTVFVKIPQVQELANPLPPPPMPSPTARRRMLTIPELLNPPQ
jgi:hypothetical protein